jgi:hypothetical protein
MDVESIAVGISVIEVSYQVCARARELFGNFGCLVKTQAFTGKWSISKGPLFST